MNRVNKTIVSFLVSVFYVLSSPSVRSQGVALPLTNDLEYHLIDRLEILSGKFPEYNSAQKPYTRGDIARFALRLDTTLTGLTKMDREDLQYIFDDNNEWVGGAAFNKTVSNANKTDVEKVYADSSKTFYTLKDAGTPDAVNTRYRLSKKPFLKYFYRTPANFYENESEFFSIRVNPILNFSIAKERDDDEYIFLNQRGLELRGSIDDRLFFYTNVIESQARFPDYATARILETKAIPGDGFYKTYASSLFKIVNGYDYLNAQAYVGFNLTRHIGLQFGYGKNEIGDGYRSLFLSDYADNYFYLKLNTRIGGFSYQNIFAELKANSVDNLGGELNVPRKYVAMHHLSYNFSPSFNMGLFEAVVFKRNNQFELEYLNPVILYRTVEGAIGSPDNELIGLNAKYNVGRKLSFYGQALFDEFVFSELVTHNKGWWGNKYGLQAGVKYINALGIDHLDMRFEYNSVRPYTYTHFDTVTNYSHNLQPLAHPLGANFKEFILTARYQPSKKWIFDARLIHSQVGEDRDSLAYGGNIFVPYFQRVSDYGNVTGQGVKATILLTTLDVSYVIGHNFFLDFHFLARKKDSDDPNRNERTLYGGIGLRANIGNKRLDF